MLRNWRNTMLNIDMMVILNEVLSVNAQEYKFLGQKKVNTDSSMKS